MVGTGGGMGMKPPDRWSVGLCVAHHREQHLIGHEAFDAKHGVDLRSLAEALARRSPYLEPVSASPAITTYVDI
jgi:hypothetical protein